MFKWLHEDEIATVQVVDGGMLDLKPIKGLCLQLVYIFYSGFHLPY